MNSKRLFLTSLIAGSLVIGSTAYAKGGKFCKQDKSGKYNSEQMAERKVERLAYRLNLSQAQKNQVEAITKNSINTMRPLHEKKRALRGQIKALDPTASDYDAKLAGIANIKSELTRQITITRGEARKQIAIILTPEQRAKMKQLRGKRGGGKGFRGMRKHKY